MVAAADILKAGILIVDDHEADISLLEQILRGHGYSTISSTTDPSEVCGLHAQHGYDLILLDLEMPVMDGFQVMAGLKEIDPGGYLPVLVITALAEHKLRALAAGAKDFVTKPFELAEVLARVRNMLEVRLLHAETKAFAQEMERQKDELQNAIDQVKLLSGLLPICAWCKKIRDEKGEWTVVEQYVRQHSEADFTHGICPDCLKQHL